MKVLMLASYVTINSRSKYTRNRTGFGYMVYDIARGVAQKENVEMLLSDTRDTAFSQDGIRFLPRSYGLFLRYLWQCVSIGVVFGMWRKYHIGKGDMARLFYYWLASGYYRHIIRTGGYDIVHIHGCRFSTELWIRICQQEKQKFVVTLHGLNSFADSVSIGAAGRKHEREFLQRVADKEFPITVISTGMKKVVEKEYAIQDGGNISVVCNAFSFPQGGNNNFDVRQKYGIPEEAKVVLYVGNVSKNKNQKQIIDAFGLLEKEIASNVYILFLGGQLDTTYTVDILTRNHPYKEHIIAAGFIDKLLLPNYYAQADAVSLMSISEGFGLSLIEGMHFGLPCMCFDDIDAFEDIYTPDAVVGVPEHTDARAAKGLMELLTRHWDKEAIQEASTRFELGTMADKYIQVYHKILANG